MPQVNQIKQLYHYQWFLLTYFLEVLHQPVEKSLYLVVDPHTAVGVGAVRKLGLEKNCVVLSTAHPCKFPKAIEDAISKTENLPDSLKYINDRKEKFELLSNDIEKVKKYVMNSV